MKAAHSLCREVGVVTMAPPRFGSDPKLENWTSALLPAALYLGSPRFPG